MVLRRLPGKFRTAVFLTLNSVRDPARRERLSRIVALGIPKPEIDGAGRANAERIRADGFVVLCSPFDQDKLRRVQAELQQRLCFDAWKPERGLFLIEDAPEDANTFHVSGVESIREAVEIANDPQILSAVSAYLGCRPTIDDILAWWSLPGRAAPREEQFFHRDRDSIRFVKLFVYLSDVGEQDGPHIFVRGSHRTKVLSSGPLRKSDAEVAANVEADDITHFTGAFGTLFLEDTSGIHKGTLPTVGKRLILQVRYAMLPSLNAAPSQVADTSGFDPYVNRRIAARG